MPDARRRTLVLLSLYTGLRWAQGLLLGLLRLSVPFRSGGKDGPLGRREGPPTRLRQNSRPLGTDPSDQQNKFARGKSVTNS